MIKIYQTYKACVVLEELGIRIGLAYASVFSINTSRNWGTGLLYKRGKNLTRVLNSKTKSLVTNFTQIFVLEVYLNKITSLSIFIWKNWKALLVSKQETNFQI